VQAERAAALLRGSGAVLRTPLVKLNVDCPYYEVYLKLENIQSISSFKIRGAGSAILSADQDAVRKQGVFTASAGNMGQGVAKFAQELGVPCTVVVPDSAPLTKVDAIKRLGAKVCKVTYDEWWTIIEMGTDAPILAQLSGVSGVFVHPVCDQDVMVGTNLLPVHMSCT